MVVLLIAFVSATTYGQKLKCKQFKTGTFIIPGNARVPESKLKRSKTIQIETTSELTSTRYDISWIDDCNYVLKRSADNSGEEISELEKKIDAEGGLRIQMLKTVNDTMYLRASATIDGNVYPLDGYQLKIS